MITRVITFDLGSKCGWAVLRDGNIESGVQTFDLKRGESSGMRYVRFNAFLEELFIKIAPELVVFEMAHHRGGYATQLLLGMATRVEEKCAKMGDIPCSSVHSGTLKKFATGHGKGSKEEMIDYVEKRFGKQVKDDNEADALTILAWVSDEYKVDIGV